MTQPQNSKEETIIEQDVLAMAEYYWKHTEVPMSINVFLALLRKGIQQGIKIGQEKAIKELDEDQEKYLEFKDISNTEQKTKKFMVWSKCSDCCLGFIRWDGGWRHYLFFPTLEFETKHSDRCMINIGRFTKKLNEEYKELKAQQKGA